MKSTIKSYLFAAALVFGAASISQAQVKIGTAPEIIDPSAILHLESTNKGFLPSRVALTGSRDGTTIPSPATGLVVYNTATVSTAGNSIAPGLVINNGTPAEPRWGNVQVFSDYTGTRVDKLRYLGTADQSKTVIIDNFYELRIRPNGTYYPIEIRLLADPGAINHVIRYNRFASSGYGFSSSLSFVGGATGTWNTYQALEVPNLGTGFIDFDMVWSSPQRDRLYVGKLQFSVAEFVNLAVSSY